MKRSEWNKFVKARDRCRAAVEELRRALPGLQSLQQRLVDARAANSALAYTVETPIVYNTALDDVTAADEIRLLLVADNPGRREQAACSRRYLTGPSGKIAERFFRENPLLEIDFRKNVIILNKTPVHTPRTAELRELCRLGGGSPALTAAIGESQRCMARILLEFHRAFDAVPVWITGYSELKRGGIFEAYLDELQKRYGRLKIRDRLFLYRHFSMNQFTADLKRQAVPPETAGETLARIGASYRQRILGW